MDGKGYTPEGNKVILDEHAAKSENEVNINEKTDKVIVDEHEVPMVTLVPCPADTLIMFASLSGMLISLLVRFCHLLFMFYFYLYQW